MGAGKVVGMILSVHGDIDEQTCIADGFGWVAWLLEDEICAGGSGLEIGIFRQDIDAHPDRIGWYTAPIGGAVATAAEEEDCNIEEALFQFSRMPAKCTSKISVEYGGINEEEPSVPVPVSP